ncbi:unnamed protein product [Trifolium pratense]|uniref:Uncharacterized protein n=1 Tax=Trifolium pratense TaxID=57577 RepID=A0ACB0K0F1_TRIPR|nr:unnamed protein product [Trifolium pratense]
MQQMIKELNEKIKKNGIGVEISSWIKPKIELLLSVAFSLTKHIVTVPAEFPGTSLSCISMLPKRYSFLDWNPEPEALSRERVRSWPLSSILARPSPQVISKFWQVPANIATPPSDR